MTGPGPVLAGPGPAGAAGPRLSAGVLSADLTRLGAELDLIRGRAHWAHVDVMDGSFCPQLTVGPAFLRAVASAGVPVDAHLLVDEPQRFLPEVVSAGAAIVTVHVESTRHPHRALQELTALAAAAGRPVIRGIAINPGTPVQAIEPVLELADLVLVLAVNPGWSGQGPAANTARRIAAVRELARAADHPVMVGIDGGVTRANAAQMAGWGADLVVSGSAIFDGNDPSGNLAAILTELAGVGVGAAPAPAAASTAPADSFPATPPGGTS
jgi:ribulose-phosphate 3-epimerase